MNCAHPPECECAECAALLRACERALSGATLDAFEALCVEFGDALFELPDDAAERLIWWRAVNSWVGPDC